jgi:hypothetical protein
VKSRESIWKQRLGLLIVAALFLIANIGFLVGARSITAARRAALEEERAALTAAVAAKEAEAAKLQGESRRLAQVSTVMDEFYGKRVGSRRETLAPIVEEIHSVLQKNEVSPVSLSYGTSSLKSLPLSQMVVGFNFNSDYPRFKRLLASIETDRRWLVVRDVALTRVTETPGQVQVHMVLATNFSDEDRMLAPAAPVLPARRTVKTVERRVDE